MLFLVFSDQRTNTVAMPASPATGLLAILTWVIIAPSACTVNVMTSLLDGQWTILKILGALSYTGMLAIMTV